MNFDTCNGVIHVVKRGDTLYKLSRIYKVKLSDIISANPYINVYNMQPGDEVCIPVIMEEDFLIYTVQDGDTFEDVLKNTGVSPDDLFKFNPDLYKMALAADMEIKYVDFLMDNAKATTGATTEAAETTESTEAADAEQAEE